MNEEIGAHTKSQESRGTYWTAFSTLFCSCSLFASFFSSHLPPLSSVKPLTLTTTGVHFHTLQGGCYCGVRSVWQWKRSGGGGGVARNGTVGEVWREPSQIWQRKNNHKCNRSWSNQINNLAVFLFLGAAWRWLGLFLYCSVSSPLCFLFLVTASWGESSVFINREDNSISVAVMHTGWALMKTDALSVEAEARGDSSQPSLLCLARGTLMITRWNLFI